VASKAEYEKIKQEQRTLATCFYRTRGLCFVFMLFALLSGPTISKVNGQDTAVKAASTVAVKQEEMHSPHKATLYALFLPGSGQIYNRKYWKVPIVYAGFGTCIYFITYNTKIYRDVKEAYEWASVTKNTVYPPTPPFLFDSIPGPPNEYAEKYTADQLKTGVDSYRRNLEVNYILTGVWYLLTVVDAVVDAHFFDYDINSDLSLKVKPWVPGPAMNSAYSFSGGLNLTLRF
jgi:hypothetical protein